MKHTKTWNISKKYWTWFQKWANEQKLSIIKKTEENNRYLITTEMNHNANKHSD